MNIQQKLPDTSSACLDRSGLNYIDLMIKTLSASLYTESAWKRFHIDDRYWYKNKNLFRVFKYFVKTIVYNFLERSNLEIYHRIPYNPQDRRVGRDWPEFLGFTMIGERRLRNIVDSVCYVVEHQIPGQFMEAGVWRGGASIMMKATLNALGQTRKVYLADSFQGMPKANHPKDSIDISAVDVLSVSEQDVLANFEKFNLLDDNVITIPGFFSDSLPTANIPPLAILRLDADMYESTLTCLNILFDKVVKGGVIIIDDYFSWKSCREAVGDFFESRKISPSIVQIDQDSAYFIKSN